jgi:23S rRNA (uracil1939-C5)-methyltransferase
VLAGKPTITERVGGIEIEVSPESFVQTNTVGAAHLYDLAAERADLTGAERVLDLYCGTGLIGLWVRNRAREVVGVESVPEAIADAERLRDRLNAESVRFVTRLAEDVLPQWTASGERFDVAFVDPPRMGMHPKALTALAELAPSRIVYVSCNPRSLARDVATLTDAGYVSSAVQPVDMFPQTAHVECVMALDRA